MIPEIAPDDELRLSVGVIPEVVMDRRMGPEVPIGQATAPGGEIRPGEMMSVRLPTAIVEQLGEVEEEEEIPPTQGMSDPRMMTIVGGEKGTIVLRISLPKMSVTVCPSRTCTS